MAISSIDAAILVIYMLAMVAFGLWVGRAQKDLSGYLLGGRDLPWWAILGPDATDEQNNQHLLQELAGVPFEKRTAHYVCHMSLSDRQGNPRIHCEQQCRGRILAAPRGTGGFGYDPLFELPEYHRTFGELGATVKSILSHRSRAIRRFVPQVLEMLKNEGWS